MLQRLIINNYALIDRLDLTFGSGLSIITGETGAGKSIMLGALSLLLGGRADTKAIADKSSKSIIEAVFADVDDSVRHIMEHNGLDWLDGEVTLRREITPAGRSRAFVNDTPVTLQVLAEVATMLVDIHSQHSNQLLVQSIHQQRLIDAFGVDREVIDNYRTAFRTYAGMRSRLKTLREETTRAVQARELLEFQLDQLDKLNPRPGELAKVEREFDMLSDADEIRERLGNAIGWLGGNEGSALNALSEARAALDYVDFAVFGEQVGEELMERLKVLAIEAKDISETLEHYMSNVEADPIRLAKVSARMNQLYEANKRFKIVEDDGLVRLRERLRSQFESIVNADSNIEELEAETRRMGRVLKEHAERLSEQRRASAVAFGALLGEMARPLGLKNLVFEAKVEQGRLTAEGQDTVTFYCAFNKNQELQPMSKVASGGEMARMMLCIKSIMASRMNLPTVIFDEIDTGVSGDIADRMGSMMGDMGKEMQVLTITHLPQVASKGANHYKVYKADNELKTVTCVRHLTQQERVKELARMLAGKEIDTAALRNARSLLRQGK
ncbi:MAG: DNA repair protein RecN [Muribaculaceae bacterium]|nr:DNA repair protein RecN [Muribaculaceae bacterium]